MAERKIKIQSGKEVVWMEVTEEEYQKYYRPWWKQKKAEQRNREAMAEKGFSEESYEAWYEDAAGGMGVPDSMALGLEELLEKKILLEMLEEAMETLVPAERELAVIVIGEQVPVSEFAKEHQEHRTTVSSRKKAVLEKLRVFFRGEGFDV